MSEYTTPIGPIFELQRETIKRSVEMMQLPREIRMELYSEGTAAGEQLRQYTLDLTRKSIHQSLDVAETVQVRESGVGELRDLVDEVFDALEKQQAEAFEAADEMYERADREILLYAIQEIDLLLELNQTVESHLVSAVEHIETKATSGDELAAEIEAQIDRLSEHLEEQTERYNEIEADLDGAMTAATNGGVSGTTGSVEETTDAETDKSDAGDTAKADEDETEKAAEDDTVAEDASKEETSADSEDTKEEADEEATETPDNSDSVEESAASSSGEQPADQ